MVSVYFPTEGNKLQTRVRSIWAARKSFVIARKILQALNIDNPQLARQIGANLLKHGFIDRGRIAADKVSPAVLLILKLISLYLPSGARLETRQIQTAIVEATREKISFGVTGFSPGLLKAGRYAALREKILGAEEVGVLGRRALELEDVLGERISLEKELHGVQVKLGELRRELAAKGSLITGVKDLMQATLSATDLEVFYSQVAEMTYKRLGCDRAIVFIYAEERNALVARANPKAGNPYAGKDAAKIADIEAFLGGELVVPLDAEGQKALSKRLMRRALRLAPTKQSGSATARRLLRNLPMILRKQRPKGKELGAEEKAFLEKYSKLGIQSKFMGVNLEALEYGFGLEYKEEGAARRVALVKDVFGKAGISSKVILAEVSLAEIEKEVEMSAMDGSDRRAVLENRMPRVAEMLLGYFVLSRFFTQTSFGDKKIPVRMYIGEEIKEVEVSERSWKEIWEPAESIITRTFREGRGFKVDVNDPQVKISPALVAMWGTISFATAPIKVRYHVQRGSETVEEERTIGILGLDNDVTETRFSDSTMEALQTLADIIALQYMLVKHRASLEGVIGRVCDEEVSRHIQRKLLRGQPIELGLQPWKGVILHVGLYSAYEANRPIPGSRFKREGAHQTLGASFKAVVDRIIRSGSGISAGGDRRGGFVCWGKKKDEVTDYTAFAEAALDVAFQLLQAGQDILNAQPVHPPVFMRVGLIQTEIEAGMMEVEGRQKFVVSGNDIPQAESLAREGRGLIISREVFESLSEDWKQGLLQRVITGVAGTMPRYLVASALTASYKPQILGLLRAIEGHSVSQLLGTAGRFKEAEIEKRLNDEIKRIEREMTGFSSGIFFKEAELNSLTLFPEGKAGEILGVVLRRLGGEIGKIKGSLAQEVEAAIARRVDFLADAIIDVVDGRINRMKYKPARVAKDAPKIVQSILTNNPGFGSLLGDRALINGPLAEFVRVVVEDPGIYQKALAVFGVTEEEGLSPADASADTCPEMRLEEITRANSAIQELKRGLKDYWQRAVLGREEDTILPDDLDARWEQLAREMNEKWRELASQEGFFERYFEDYLRRLDRQTTPLQVVSRMELASSSGSGVIPTVEREVEKGIFCPVKDEEGEIVAYEVNFHSLDPKHAGYWNIAYPACALLKARQT